VSPPSRPAPRVTESRGDSAGGAELFARGEEYDAMLAQGLRLAGEDKAFFAAGRLDSLFRSLPPGFAIRRILDYGCGIGDTTAALAARAPGAEVVGVDVAEEPLALARSRHRGVDFAPAGELASLGAFDLCYVNGVVHHVPPRLRGEVLAAIFAALRPGGCLALFDNNFWNPGAWLVMRRIPFDRGLRPQRAGALRRLLLSAGFAAPITTRYLFFAPRALAFLRPLERTLVRVPLGAQFQLLARKPERG
jgi:SAM-dependent methyltransferase